MSLEPHWYSTMYGVIFMVSQALARWRSRRSRSSRSRRGSRCGASSAPGIRHDLGKMMFAFVMIWAYVNFSQYLIVWSGNIPEEIHWYLARFRGGWGAGGPRRFWSSTSSCRSCSCSRARPTATRGSLAGAAGLLVVMRFVDTAWLVLPAFSRGRAPSTGRTWPLPIGLGGLWLAFYVRNL